MLRRSTLMRTARVLSSVIAVVVYLFPLQAQDPNATVLEMTGSVSVMSGVGGYATPLFQGGSVKQQQMIVTGKDGYARFQVSSDGSTFEVFPNSRVIFREQLGNWKDLLDIMLGRVKVFIYHAPGQINRNRVSSPTAVISVRGTVFDVVVEDDDATVISVDEGIVGVQNSTTFQPKDVELHAGDSIRVERNVPLAAQKIDKTRILQRILLAGRDAIWQAVWGRQSPIGLPGGSSGGVGAQGDKGKPTPGTGTGAPGTGPGAPSTGPGAPSTGPTAPGGH